MEDILRKILNMNLSFKVFSTSFLVTIFSLSLMAFLTFFKYESTLSGLISSRFEVTVSDVAGTIRNGLALGVSLSELHNTQDVIDKVKLSDREISSIQVFELNGNLPARTVYHTRRVGIGSQLPSSWKIVMEQAAPGSIWTLRDDGVNVIGTTILNKFNEAVGAIAVRYGQDNMALQSKYMRKEFFILLGQIIMAIAFFLLIGSYYFFKPISFMFKRLKDLVQNFLITQKIDHFKTQTPLENEFINILKLTEHVNSQISKISKKMD